MGFGMLTRKQVLLSGALIALTATMFLLPACNILFFNQQQPALILPTRAAPPPGDDGPVRDPSDPWGGDGDDGTGPGDTDPGDGPGDTDPGDTTPDPIFWKGLLVNHHGQTQSMIDELNHITSIFRDSIGYDNGGMHDGDTIYAEGSQFDGDAFLTNVLDDLCSPTRPTFVHLTGHGINVDGIPFIRLDNTDSTLEYEDIRAEQFYVDGGSFAGVELIFINVCYVMSRETIDMNNWAYVCCDKMNGGSIIGSTSMPDDYAAYFMATQFWEELLDLKGVNSINKDNIQDNIKDAFLHGSVDARHTAEHAADAVVHLVTAGVHAISGALECLIVYEQTAALYALASGQLLVFAGLESAIIVELLIFIWWHIALPGGIQLLSDQLWMNGVIHPSLDAYQLRRSAYGEPITTGGAGHHLYVSPV